MPGSCLLMSRERGTLTKDNGGGGGGGEEEAGEREVEREVPNVSGPQFIALNCH